MNSVLRVILGFATACVIVLTLKFAHLGYTRITNPIEQNIERVTFENTQSYVDGKRQEALKYYNEYRDASMEEKLAIEQTVKMAFGTFDEGKLNEPLRGFVFDCKYNR